MARTVVTSRAVRALAMLLIAGLPVDAAAQSTGSVKTAAVVAPRWEIEGYGGLSLGRFSSGGEATLPLAGAPITTSSPVFPSWSVPTWFIGDGAGFLNNVAAAFGLSSRLTPLDEWLRPIRRSDAGDFMAGARLTRQIRAPWSVEIGVELSSQPVGVPDELRDALATTASTFQATFSELLSTGQFTAPVVNSGVAAEEGTARDIAITVALGRPLRPFGSFTPYVLAGGGIILPEGDAATAGVSGRYRFQIAGSAPVDETDVLTVHYRGRVAFAAVAGGGVRRPLSERWGIRIDARMLAGPATSTVEVDSAPASVTGTPAGFIESFTYPNLQFSNNPSTGRRSTLGPPALAGVEVFKGGWSLRGRATVGVYVLF
jgi:hypothetical protein